MLDNQTYNKDIIFSQLSWIFNIAIWAEQEIGVVFGKILIMGEWAGSRFIQALPPVNMKTIQYENKTFSGTEYELDHISKMTSYQDVFIDRNIDVIFYDHNEFAHIIVPLEQQRGFLIYFNT